MSTRLQSRMQTRKNNENAKAEGYRTQNMKTDSQIFDYMGYRDVLHTIMSRKIPLSEGNKLTDAYLSLLFSELGRLILDIPVMMIGIIIIIAPWRGKTCVQSFKS